MMGSFADLAWKSDGERVDERRRELTERNWHQPECSESSSGWLPKAMAGRLRVDDERLSYGGSDASENPRNGGLSIVGGIVALDEDLRG